MALQLDQFVRRLRHTLDATDALSDAALLQRFVATRDEAAFEVLVWRHGALVLNVSHKLLHQAEDAEDVFQATFLTLARKAPSITRPAALPGWLCRTASRLALRLRARRPVLVGDADIDRAVAAETDSGDDIALLLQELDRLPDRYRLPVILCHLNGLTTIEAARQLGCPKGTICTRLAVARRKLHARLVRRGVATAVAATAFAALASAAQAHTPPALVTATVRAAALLASGQALARDAIRAEAAQLLHSTTRPVTALQMTLPLLMLALLGAGLWVSWPAAAPTATDALVTVPAQSGKTADDESKQPAAEAKPLTLKVPNLTRALLSPDGKWLAVATGNTVKLFDARTGTLMRQFPFPVGVWIAGKPLPQPEHTAHALTFSADSKLLAIATEDKWIRIWDLDTGKLSNSLQTEHTLDIAVGFSAGGKELISVGGWRPWLAFVDGPHLKIHDLTTGKQKHAFKTPSYMVGRALLSPNSQYSAGIDMDKELKIFATASGKTLFTHKDQAAVGFSADSKQFAEYGKDGMVRLYSLSDGKLLTSFKVPAFKGPGVGQLSEGIVAFHPTGKYVAVASTGAVEHPDGKVLVTSEVTLWEVATGKQVHALTAPAPAPPAPWSSPTVHSLAFSPDGQRLMVASNNDTVQVLPLKLP